MKRVIIVHCWEGRPDFCWYQPDGEGDAVIVKELPDVIEAIKKMASGR